MSRPEWLDQRTYAQCLEAGAQLLRETKAMGLLKGEDPTLAVEAAGAATFVRVGLEGAGIQGARKIRAALEFLLSEPWTAKGNVGLWEAARAWVARKAGN